MGHSNKTTIPSNIVNSVGCKNCGKYFYDICNVNKAKLMKKLHAKVCIMKLVDNETSKFTNNHFNIIEREKSNEKINKFNIHSRITNKFN
jgi:hypothetical protein